MKVFIVATVTVLVFVALREIEREMHDPRNIGLRWGDAIMRISPFFIGGS